MSLVLCPLMLTLWYRIRLLVVVKCLDNGSNAEIYDLEVDPVPPVLPIPISTTYFSLFNLPIS